MGSSIADVIVIGGGVIGCAVVYELAKRKVRVLLLDKTLPGRATSASAGGLWPVGEAIGLGCGVIYHAAARRSNNSHPEAAPAPQPLAKAFQDFLVASNGRFPGLAVALRELTGIDIEYEPDAGLLFVIYDQIEEATVKALVRSLPLDTRLEMLSQRETARLEPRLTHDLLGGALLTGEHQVNPMLLAEAYKRAAIGLGAAVRYDTRVTGIKSAKGRVHGVQIPDEFLACDTVVNSAGAWSGELAETAGLHLPVSPVRGQIVLTQALSHTLNCCLSTTTCYLLQKAHGEVLIGSTTEHAGFDVSVTPQAIQSLCRGALRAVPMLRQVGVKRAWAGLRPGTPDELPILGPVEALAGYFNASGGFRTGIVAAPLTGEVVAQAVLREQPSYPLQPFLMSRFDGAERSRTEVRQFTRDDKDRLK